MTEYSLSKDKIKVVLLEGVHESAPLQFQNAGYHDVTYCKTSLKGTELQKMLAQAHILGIRSRTQLNLEVLQAAPKLMAVGCFCIG